MYRTICATFVSLLVLAQSSCAMNISIRSATRRDHESLSCINRRLEVAMKSDNVEYIRQVLKGCQRHVEPMLARHGGEAWFPIELGSDGEFELINIQYGNAGSSTDTSGFWGDLAMGFCYWIVCRLWTLVPFSPLVALLYWGYRKWKKMSKHYDHAIEIAHPDKEERKNNPAFRDPVIVKAHAELNPKSGNARSPKA